MEPILKIIETYKGVFKVLEGNKKMMCILTKHEIPCNEDALSSYIKGKKFQLIYNKMKAPEKYVFKVETKYKEFFIPSKKSKVKVFCRLTKKEINNVPHEIEQHIAGYRFKKAYFYFKEGTLKIAEEKPDEKEGQNEEDQDQEMNSEDGDGIPSYAFVENSDIENDEEIDSDEAVGDDDEIKQAMKSNCEKSNRKFEEKMDDQEANDDDDDDDDMIEKEEKTAVKSKGKKRKNLDTKLIKPITKISKKTKKKKKDITTS